MSRAPFGLARRAVVLAAGVALTATMVSAPTTGQASELRKSARAATEVVPVVADLQITRTTVDTAVERQIEREIHHFYRDSMARTRVESGTSVTITDPVAQVSIILDTEARTFQQIPLDQARPEAADRPTDVTHHQQLSSSQPLGEIMIEGVAVEGWHFTVTAPEQDGLSGQSYEVTRWMSADLQLPVVTRVVYPDGRVHEERYTNIQTGTEPATELFQIPDGYQEAGTTGGHVQYFCPVAWTDLVIITSIGSYLGSGIVTALTDASLNCYFVADAASFEYPMDGYPLWPLGLSIDEWLVYDTGLPVPWLPYTAFGFLSFAAQSPTGELTIVESLVILDIF